MDTQLQIGLRNGSLTLENLEKDLGIYSRRHKDYPNLVGFSYDQILSPLKHTIVEDCRGIILDENANWEIVARPFRRFYNWGQFEDNLDWPSAKVQEKVDGSLCIVHYYDNKWHVATRGSPDASGPVGASSLSFKQLFWDTWAKVGMGALDPLNGHLTYLFELTGPLNRVVVDYPEASLTLLGARDRNTGAEVEASFFSFMENWRIVKEFPIGTIEDVIASFRDMSPFKQEGYVIVDKNFNRVKVKSPAYVSVHHLRDSFSPKNILDVIRKGEAAEILQNFSDMKQVFDDLNTKYVNLLYKTKVFYETIKGIENQKEFAFEALKSPVSGALFAIRSGKTKSFEKYFSEIHIDRLYEVLK